jgi:3'-phosphoadenosine 5'-phosphosulfate (PAPS) 3'-phosphatase
MHDLAAELALARAAAARAGAEALRLQRTAARQTKADGSPVTDGDLAADRIVREAIAGAFPGDAILSEERADDSVRLAAHRLWIIDPIDGTRSYADGGGEWCVQVALAIGGRIVLGVLDLPARGLQVWGAAGLGGGLADGTGERALAAGGGVRDVLAGSASDRSRPHVARVLAALPEFTYLQAHSVGVKAAQILLGEADLFVHPRRIAEWDAAAPAAVLAHAGAIATDLAGAELCFNSADGKVPGLVFSRRGDHAEICSRLAGAGIACA